ncbi:MAG: glycosyltransferase family 2 protein [Bacteroidota bacterium]
MNSLLPQAYFPLIIEYMVWGFLFLRAGVVLINVFTNPKLKSTLILTGRYPKLSILIPARNEAENLPRLLDQLLSLSYPYLEILVLNDQSEDETRTIVQEYSDRFSEVKLYDGAPLPDGWLGKNWACHQLSQYATGDYYLFLDADVSELRPGVLEVALAHSGKYNLSLLSIFPDQWMGSLGERSLVPLMHYLLLSLLPMWWVYRLPFPSVAAANGQFMLFESKAYLRNRWHQQARGSIIEDIEIMRMVKKAKLKGMTFLGGGVLRCRMYRSYREARSGFSKNLLAGFGNSMPALGLFLFMVVLGWGVVALYASTEKIFLGIGLMLIIRLGVSYLANQSWWMNFSLHPIQMLNLVIISVLSISRKISGINLWKGRNVHL